MAYHAKKTMNAGIQRAWNATYRQNANVIMLAIAHVLICPFIQQP